MLSPHLLELLRNWWPVLRPKGTHVRHRSFRTRSYPPIPRNGASPGHADRHLMISVLQPPARKICRLFRWFPTDHGEAQTTNTAACRVEVSMPPISAKHRPLHPRLASQRLQIPISRCCSTSHPPRFRSLQVFERRRAEPVAGSARVAGRHPKTSTKADIPILFDHLVGADQDGCR